MAAEVKHGTIDRTDLEGTSEESFRESKSVLEDGFHGSWTLVKTRTSATPSRTLVPWTLQPGILGQFCKKTGRPPLNYYSKDTVFKVPTMERGPPQSANQRGLSPRRHQPHGSKL
jgi:hypothetical protein